MIWRRKLLGLFSAVAAAGGVDELMRQILDGDPGVAAATATLIDSHASFLAFGANRCHFYRTPGASTTRLSYDCPRSQHASMQRREITMKSHVNTKIAIHTLALAARIGRS